MRYFSAFLLCLGLSFIFGTGCAKNLSLAGPESLQGTWELRRTTAAMNPNDQTYAAGNGNTLKFQGDHFEKYSNGVLELSGHFNVVEDPTVSESVCLVITDGKYKQRLELEGYTGDKLFFQIVNGRLEFISGCYALDGGHTSEYEKISSH